jgi:uncharacterized membrane protein (DUF2068 family)
VLNLVNQEKVFESKYHFSRYIVAYELAHGFIELVIGLGLLFFGRQAFNFYQQLAYRELLEDPHDLLVNLLQRVFPYLLNHKNFVVLTLTLFGVSKIIGAIGLALGKNWGQDVLVAVAGLLVPLELYELITGFSFFKFALLAINLLVLIYLYNYRSKSKKLKLIV